MKRINYPQVVFLTNFQFSANSRDPAITTTTKIFAFTYAPYIAHHRKKFNITNSHVSSTLTCLLKKCNYSC